MSYNPAVPNQANAVRGGTGDLLTMQGNFDALAPLVSAYLISGAVPSAVKPDARRSIPCQWREFTWISVMPKIWANWPSDVNLTGCRGA